MGVRNKEAYILIFAIGKLKVGLSLLEVDRVIQAVEYTNLPGAPKLVLGLINYGGQSIPLLDFRMKFKLRKKEITPLDKIIIVNSDSLDFGFFVDEVAGLRPLEPAAFKKTGDVIPGSNELLEGVTIIDDEIVYIQDVNKFLSLKEEKQLKVALKKNDKEESGS